MVSVLLKYQGSAAENHELDFYDASRALAGFQRSLALTTHLVVNGEIITQAPSLKNARILLNTPRPGSWEVVAMVVGGLWATGTASKDTPFGHLLYSVYDYIITQTLGFPVDYNKSLFQSYTEELRRKDITPSKLDSLSEKVEASIADMHRPVIASKTATRGDLFAGESSDPRIRLGKEMNEITYDYIKQFEISEQSEWIHGVISSYNINTYSGRIFSFEESRPISFEIEDGFRHLPYINSITSSLRNNALDRGKRDGAIELLGRKVTSSTGRLKGIKVTAARDA